MEKRTQGSIPGVPPAADQLTPRQRSVVALLAQGHTMSQAAAKLDITPRTIAFHKYRVMKRQGIRTNADLILFAARQGLVHL
jgi:DNA-binding CsgD family transcriptional regulator